jgi:hypothetical protein
MAAVQGTAAGTPLLASSGLQAVAAEMCTLATAQPSELEGLVKRMLATLQQELDEVGVVLQNTVAGGNRDRKSVACNHAHADMARMPGIHILPPA